MAITLWRKRRPLEGLARFFDDSWFDTDLFGNDAAALWAPAVDIEEQDGAYLLKADLPGLKKDDIHVELHDGYLTLKGERTSENEKKQGGYKRYERVYGSFERTFRVPEGVTEKDIKANYRDGVLELTIPAPKAEKPKAIDIRVE
jgi:HSP20 family protein